ncbi:MAG: hypothetical protein A3F17_00975 [Gammaproteobacteria bacterium RIFCSPHIGHO2_12_FULL_41_15]|nr:MAG: hypothetical protein A3F17_00975 [Gammaproteobacteria bacterium RIFCSPHIGHO2_12_FULL_41_15]
MEQGHLVMAFEDLVAIKYQLYNSLFLTLPFKNLTDVGVELPLFTELCRSALAQGQNPSQIIAQFFHDIAHCTDFNAQAKILFLMLQFVERQVVLFDALEEAAFAKTNDLSAIGTLTEFLKPLNNESYYQKVYHLLHDYCIRIVLTAHPTQFYPMQVLGIIEDLTHAIQANQLKEIRLLLLQLGKTSFKNPKKPTPFDEANILMHYLEASFYPVIKELQHKLEKTFQSPLPCLVQLGFWSGGDRDGNPNVTAEITIKVAKKLKFSILKRYIREVRALKRRLTFQKMWPTLDLIKNKLLATQIHLRSFSPTQYPPYSCAAEFIADLEDVKNQLIQSQNGLFVEQVESVLCAVRCFGFHFASIDVRQNSRVHTALLQNIMNYHLNLNYSPLTEPEKCHALNTLFKIPALNNASSCWQSDALFDDVIQSLKAMRFIQQENGETAANRYIISNTQSASQILEILILARCAGWEPHAMSIDIVPLFETIPDLENAAKVMEILYRTPLYYAHLQQRGLRQTVMLGFSDGTKDGGYITANWKIFCCKQAIFNLSKKMGIYVYFFDGRGGPPARGGGNTHLFYRAMEGMIEQQQIQLTIQGQTVSSKFGSTVSAKYNIEQLFTSGLLGPVSLTKFPRLTAPQYALLERFSALAYDCYQQLKNHPLFTAYLETITPLNYFGDLNIASRPPRRKSAGPLHFEDLRAIPFVSAWSQIKQNIPGFYGLGSALQTLVAEGEEPALQQLYRDSLFFRTLLENAMQSLLKSNFQLTAYLAHHPIFGDFWHLLQQEAIRSTDLLKKISGQKALLECNPVIRDSIHIREHLVLPLLVIQQHALLQLQILEKKNNKACVEYKTYYNLVLKSLAANINASRNSA